MGRGKHLLKIYHSFFERFGPQHWWPGETPFEVIIGAILTQNTSWKNVEKAINSLKASGHFTPKGLYDTPIDRLAQLIRSSGYFNIKAKRLKNFLSFLFNEYEGDLEAMLKEDGLKLQDKLLKVNGLGPETVDSILLYAAGFPIFVVDAYTKRIFSRHGDIKGDESYHQIQTLFMESLPRNKNLYNEYHALIVRAGKELCKKKPLCHICPIEYDLHKRSKNVIKIGYDWKFFQKDNRNSK